MLILYRATSHNSFILIFFWWDFKGLDIYCIMSSINDDNFISSILFKMTFVFFLFVCFV